VTRHPPNAAWSPNGLRPVPSAEALVGYRLFGPIDAAPAPATAAVPALVNDVDPTDRT
jgi:hypothetical protein